LCWIYSIFLQAFNTTIVTFGRRGEGCGGGGCGGGGCGGGGCGGGGDDVIYTIFDT